MGHHRSMMDPRLYVSNVQGAQICPSMLQACTTYRSRKGIVLRHNHGIQHKGQVWRFSFFPSNVRIVGRHQGCSRAVTPSSCDSVECRPGQQRLLLTVWVATQLYSRIEEATKTTPQEVTILRNAWKHQHRSACVMCCCPEGCDKGG